MDDIGRIKLLLLALRRHVAGGRAIPAFIMFTLMALPSAAFFLAAMAEIVTEQFGHRVPLLKDLPLPWGAAVACSVIFLMRYSMRTVRLAKEYADFLQTKASLVENGTEGRRGWLFEEVEAQRLAMDIPERPTVLTFKLKELEVWSAFAHAGLLDPGRVAMPEEWLENLSEDELRFIVGHELSHIKNSDGLIRQITASAVDVLATLPATIIGGYIGIILLMLLLFAVPLGILALIFVLLGSFQIGLEMFSSLITAPFKLLTQEPISTAELWLCGVLAIGMALVAYGRYVARGQEARADVDAAQIVGVPTAGQALRALLARQCDGDPQPLPTAAVRRDAIRKVIWAWLWFVSKADREKPVWKIGVHSLAAAFDTIFSLALTIPGIPFVCRLISRIWLEHPSLEWRLENVLRTNTARGS
ncbi:MAG: hypothetical protein FD119_118 [Stygiobacter sp.]|nr:MAG: hypothetical protein FD119_118 [Stygiobacter sp.]